MTKICIIANNEYEAQRWASSQNLDRSQYFYPHSMHDLMFKTNFHVIVIGIGNLSSSSSFEKLYNLALERGRVDRI